FVPKGSVAEKAGLKVGDEILAVNGRKVNGFLGSPSFDSVRESIMLSEGNEIEFTVKRDGEVLTEPIRS
ncbi:MAG: PDZ domain-containing protein, partial [Akkermansiaceae bacterium]|nr:PDZ domain-containing protein [Akkermansiaceae bacterium]